MLPRIQFGLRTILLAVTFFAICFGVVLKYRPAWLGIQDTRRIITLNISGRIEFDLNVDHEKRTIRGVSQFPEMFDDATQKTIPAVDYNKYMFEVNELIEREESYTLIFYQGEWHVGWYCCMEVKKGRGYTDNVQFRKYDTPENQKYFPGTEPSAEDYARVRQRALNLLEILREQNPELVADMEKHAVYRSGQPKFPGYKIPLRVSLNDDRYPPMKSFYKTLTIKRTDDYQGLQK